MGLIYRIAVGLIAGVLAKLVSLGRDPVAAYKRPSSTCWEPSSGVDRQRPRRHWDDGL